MQSFKSPALYYDLKWFESGQNPKNKFSRIFLKIVLDPPLWSRGSNTNMSQFHQGQINWTLGVVDFWDAFLFLGPWCGVSHLYKGVVMLL